MVVHRTRLVSVASNCLLQVGKSRGLLGWFLAGGWPKTCRFGSLTGRDIQLRSHIAAATAVAVCGGAAFFYTLHYCDQINTHCAWKIFFIRFNFSLFSFEFGNERGWILFIWSLFFQQKLNFFWMFHFKNCHFILKFGVFPPCAFIKIGWSSTLCVY